MTSRALSRDEVRALDQRAIHEFGVPGVVLMENAGRGAAELLCALGVPGPVVICCGKGNNGGDGFVIARHLDAAGLTVRILLFARPNELTGDAAINHQIVARTDLPITVHEGPRPDHEAVQRELAAAAWIVDALFGTGLSGPVRPPFDAVIRAINAAPAPVLAVDIPSGLDCDTGRPLGEAVRAAHTATFAARKRGFDSPEAAAYVGRVHVLPLGVPRQLLAHG
jgi:NAD(P)H-hydrate epimerase